jgi:hypothetical protein
MIGNEFTLLSIRNPTSKKINIEIQEFIRSENYLMNISEQQSALNFMVLATELKLLIFKISVRTFLKNFSFRKELKLFATSCKYFLDNDLRTK